MEKSRVNPVTKAMVSFIVLVLVAVLSLMAGVLWSQNADAAPGQKKRTRVVYPKNTKLDFEGLRIEGELRNPGEFYFKHRPQEKFDSLVKRRENFHREMLRDAVMSR